MAVLSYLKARPRGFLPPLARYHQVLTAHKSRVEEVRAAWQAAKQELDENYELWVRMNSGGANDVVALLADSRNVHWHIYRPSRHRADADES